MRSLRSPEILVSQFNHNSHSNNRQQPGGAEELEEEVVAIEVRDSQRANLLQQHLQIQECMNRSKLPKKP